MPQSPGDGAWPTTAPIVETVVVLSARVLPSWSRPLCPPAEWWVRTYTADINVMDVIYMYMYVLRKVSIVAVWVFSSSCYRPAGPAGHALARTWEVSIYPRCKAETLAHLSRRPKSSLQVWASTLARPARYTVATIGLGARLLPRDHVTSSAHPALQVHTLMCPAHNVYYVHQCKLSLRPTSIWPLHHLMCGKV